MTHSPYYKVLWQEGMLVAPQHFQQWDHYQEATLELRVRHLIPYSWGVISMQINPDRFNTCRLFELTQFRGVFPSGAVIDIPRGDTAPPAREVPVSLFSGIGQTVGVYLALPLEPAASASPCCPSANGDGRGSRYLPSCATVADENSRQSELEIATARKNLRILLSSEPGDGYERMKIAELGVNDGAIAINDAYVPPSLILAASPHLQSVLGRLSQTLAQRVDQAVRAGQLGPLDALALSQIGGALALLNHALAVKIIHPEVIYRGLIQLAGQLQVLSRTPECADATVYDHGNLADTFARLEQRLYRLAPGGGARATPPPPVDNLPAAY